MDPGQARAVALALRPFFGDGRLGKLAHQINASVLRTRSNLCRLARIQAGLRTARMPSPCVRTALGFCGDRRLSAPRSPPAIPSRLAICKALSSGALSTCADLLLRLSGALRCWLGRGSSVMQSNSHRLGMGVICARASHHQVRRHATIRCPARRAALWGWRRRNEWHQAKAPPARASCLDQTGRHGVRRFHSLSICRSTYGLAAPDVTQRLSEVRLQR